MFKGFANGRLLRFSASPTYKSSANGWLSEVHNVERTKLKF